MNSATLFRLAEGLVLALALVAAAGLAVLPRRRWRRRAEADHSPLAKGLYAVLAGLSFPALALGLGWLVLWLPQGVGVVWADRVPAAHRAAWVHFWLILLVYSFAETAAERVLAATGRLQMPALLRGVLRIVVTAGAAFFVLRLELGWNITPLLASTALVTAVVGFALQGVLGNLLAGMSLNLTGALAH